MEDLVLEVEQVRWLVDEGTLLVLPLTFLSSRYTLMVVVEDSVPVRVHTVHYVPLLERVSHNTVLHKCRSVGDIQRILYSVLGAFVGCKVIISPSGYRHSLLRDYTRWAASASMADYITLVVRNGVKERPERFPSRERYRHLQSTLMELCVVTGWCLDSIDPVVRAEELQDTGGRRGQDRTLTYPDAVRGMLSAIQGRLDAYDAMARVGLPVARTRETLYTSDSTAVSKPLSPDDLGGSDSMDPAPGDEGHKVPTDDLGGSGLLLDDTVWSELLERIGGFPGDPVVA